MGTKKIRIHSKTSKLTMTTTATHYGEYLLVLSGSVEYAPFLENWKTLKDSVRKNAGNPGWTDVSTASHGGIRRAWCNLSIEGKAKTAYRYYSKMPGVGVCLMKRTSNGEYLLLHYNCAAPFPAASQCNHNPCGRQENCQRLMPNKVVLPCNTNLLCVPHSMMQLRGYCLLPLRYYPLYIAGVHLPTFACGFVKVPLPLS